jgi:hypothetical protein
VVFAPLLWQGHFFHLIFGCGEAVPASDPAGILPAAVNKGKMPSPHRQSDEVDLWQGK